MHLSENFQTITTIDLSNPAVCQFRKSLLDIDWTDSSNTYIGTEKLSYAPGFAFHDIEFSNKHQSIQKALLKLDRKFIDMPEAVVRARELSKPFFDYIEQLIPNTCIVKAEIISQPPEEVSRQNELDRMHIDSRNLHIYSKRCQLGIITNSKSLLFVEDECINTSINKIITFNNRKTHWGVNWGNTPKITLIFDLLDRTVWDNLSDSDKKSFFSLSTPNDDDIRHLEFCKNFAKRHNLIYNYQK